MAKYYPTHASDEELLAVARLWDDDGADGETVHALTREVIRLRAELSRLRSATRVRVTADEPPTGDAFCAVLAWHRDREEPQVLVAAVVVREAEKFTHWLPLPPKQEAPW